LTFLVGDVAQALFECGDLAEPVQLAGQRSKGSFKRLF
jgi:hypothetical protein